MAVSRYRTTQLYSHEFVNSSGSVLFRRVANEPLQICFLRHVTKNEFLLPKGRQDRGESLAHAATRETFEETGYTCQILPVDMMTRAPESGVEGKDVAAFVEGCTEPFTVSLRHVSDRDTKFIWWFITITTSIERKNQAVIRSENFEPALFNLDIDPNDDGALDEIISNLTYSVDRDIARAAVKLVWKSYPAWFTGVKPAC